MSRSLQRHLSVVLAAAIVVAGLAAAAASFMLAFADARELQDDVLRQIAVLAAQGPEPSQADAGAEAARVDPETRILVYRGRGGGRPDWVASSAAAGFHTLKRHGEEMRVFIRDAAPGVHIVVAQPTDARDEVAVNSALRTLIPLLLLLPLLIALIVRIVRREFAPVARLARSLDARAADRAGRLDDGAVPEEVRPFVQAINRLLARVEHLVGQQRRFVADAAHELRGPLTALSVQVGNLRRADSLEGMRERMDPVQAGVERARQLTEQLLSLARTQAGGSGEGTTDVSALSRELIAELLPDAERRGIDLGLEEGSRLHVPGAAEPLRLIVRNALENALRYTPSGGEVTLRVSKEGDIAAIEVLDTGPGIPPGERERVFDPFYRVPGTTGSGSGLGLAIAREAAARLGGDIALGEREGGTGLLFSYRQRLR